MNIQLRHSLPIVSLTITRDNQSIILPDILFDTGCAATVLDTDVLSQIGIYICEQIIPELQIEHFALNDFPLQLGSMQEEPYGFNGIMGIDFMIRAKCKADFETMEITLDT